MRSLMHTLAGLFIAVALLGGCASKPLVIEGPFMQMGSVDAPQAQISLETRGSCEFWLQQLRFRSSGYSRCAAKDANLPYGYVARFDVIGDVPASFKTMELCEKSLAKIRPDEGFTILSPCKKR